MVKDRGMSQVVILYSVLANGQVQIVVATSASARDRQECWGRSRDSWYSLHVCTGTKITTKEDGGLVLLLHCEEQVDFCTTSSSGHFLCSKRTLVNETRYYCEGLHFLYNWELIKILQLCVETRNWYTNGRNDRSVFGLSAKSWPTASLKLTKVHIYWIVMKKRWYHVCHKNFSPCCHESTEVCILTLILAIKLIKVIYKTASICCWFRGT